MKQVDNMDNPVQYIFYDRLKHHTWVFLLTVLDRFNSQFRNSVWVFLFTVFESV